ncbi:hypothetical protein F53441_7232 [Fusarium austroafricanum]|uniref:Heterokaryon incompatibility domain-containing protein n=1 Tax=Fusarium austroafricanum TaxID=2364996 RepID=A0A8H4KE19_9HYPO|nr:hypothetical protein F53441_7232 [Fusarium austroafricanum]
MAAIQKNSRGHSYPGPSLFSASHIRLVHLQPGTDGDIHCELTTSSIDSAPPYEALSYTWGDPSSKQTIYMRTQASEETYEFYVTSNCLLALKRLRYKDKPRVLWIDALAIDQSNIEERNHQVSLMSKIYSQAAGVVIYLGEAGDNSDLAIEFITECDDPSPETTSLSFPKSDILMQALRDFFFRPWFTRVWVIQEVVLSAEKTVYCGDKTLSWSAMINFKHYLVNSSVESRLPYVVSTSSKHFREKDITGSTLFGPLETEPRSGIQEAMLTALLDSRHCEATDMRDKIYSLLPILDSYDTPLDLRPRYQDTLAKIYTDCAIALMPDRGWEILYAVQGQSNAKGLPSWVPDWSVPPLRLILGAEWTMERSFFWRGRDLGVPDKPQVLKRKSYGGEEPTPTLHGYGYPRGRIVKIGPTYTAGQTAFPFREWYNLIKGIEQSILSNDSILFSAIKSVLQRLPINLGKSGNDHVSEAESVHWNDDFYRFIRLAQRLYSESLEQDDYGQDWPKRDTVDFVTGNTYSSYKDYQFGSRWETTVRKLASERALGKLPFRDIPFELAAEGLPPSYRTQVRGKLEACHSRRCFITDTGYFGLAPAEAEVGDQLFLCVGAGIPFALRKKNGGKEFHLVGESYMEERAWRDLDLEKERPQPLYII